MQRVEHLTPNISPIMDDMDRLYSLLSEKQAPSLILPQFDKSFTALVDTFNSWNEKAYKWNVSYVAQPYPPLTPIKNNKILLCFSGGKDSIASAMRYKSLGYDVHLYHMQHINPSFADEWECAKKSAELLELPIHFGDIKFKGYHMWTEHPMKNMIIANGALSYAIREGLTTNIAFGNYTTSYLEDNVFDRCAGDCMDMWWAYNAIIQRVLPNFKVLSILDNMGDTLNVLADRKDLLDESLSCLCRHSLRDYRRNWVKDKFGIELFRRRCGSCYKCCVEYIYMADHDKLPFSADYYRYCLKQLYKVAQVENIPINSIRDLWDSYIFYPATMSKLYDSMCTATLTGRGIKWQ